VSGFDLSSNKQHCSWLLDAESTYKAAAYDDDAAAAATTVKSRAACAEHWHCHANGNEASVIAARGRADLTS